MRRESCFVAKMEEDVWHFSSTYELHISRVVLRQVLGIVFSTYLKCLGVFGPSHG